MHKNVITMKRRSQQEYRILWKSRSWNNKDCMENQRDSGISHAQ